MSSSTEMPPWLTVRFHSLTNALRGRSQKSKVVLRQANGGPFQRGGEAFLHLAAKGRVRIDADPFTA